MSRIRNLALVSALVLAAASPAAAQQDAAVQKPHMDHAAMHKHMCGMHYAHLAGHLASVEAMLDLNAQQKPLWDKWSGVLLDHAKTQRKSCEADAAKEPGSMTVLDQEARMEKHLSGMAETLKASRPSLEALYNALNADQKKTFDHMAIEHHMGGPGAMMMMHREMHEDGEGMKGPMPPH